MFLLVKADAAEDDALDAWVAALLLLDAADAADDEAFVA